MSEKSESYRIWLRSVKAIRKVERANKLERNISRTILFLTDFYEHNKKSSGEAVAELSAKKKGW